jgi:uncharacterized protein (DUF2252 family)
VVFDLDDFDETGPGPWEWDLKRLLAGLELAGRANDFRRKERAAVATAGAKAPGRNALQAYWKLTAVIDGRPHIVADLPLLVPAGDLVPEVARKQLETQIREVLGGYRDTLAEDRRHLFDAFDFVDLARKVVGVGSFGTRAGSCCSPAATTRIHCCSR